MSENTEHKISMYIILFVLGMGLLSALSSCSPKLSTDKYTRCYVFTK